ncbi:sugar phosphate isomerase/epimerase family protein [Paenibacillus alkalitolerans]|uniref:sugar phosphate isomerase/epimerase family protein n=1 Tax=Paenibacillus alkalitolerans TaxID=2799335 RepID=UPI0018F6E8C9|nr:sugar phosphate isomerase/epimerase family protein [Paenibacillus alkalitolerans]
MKIGLSTYSLLKALKAGTMSVLDIPRWIKDNGGEHMELVPYGYTVVDNPELADAIRDKAAEAGIELSNYSMPANFVQDTEEAFDAEVERVKQHVDIAHRMGIRFLRHDVTAFTLPPEKTTLDYFETSLPLIVEGSRRIADYAAQYGITTSIENHGFCVQLSDRVQRVLREVNRGNFKTTLDVGNFLCVDEQPLIGVMNNLPYASVVHFKDFYIRPYYNKPTGGEWFTTTHGNYLRGAIVGHGDIEIVEIVKLVKQSGFDGYITVEFEGMEDCREGSKIGMENVRRMWEES